MSIINDIRTPSDIPNDHLNRVVVATGHRPNKTHGYGHVARHRLTEVAKDWLSYLRPRGAISGMALGWDTAIVDACLDLHIPYVACVPFKGQESQWPEGSQQEYRDYLSKAARVIICSPGGYSPAKMQIRNERMVDLALQYGPGPANAILLSLWDGTQGGTKNCVYYANTRLEILNCWNDFNSRF